MDDFKSVNPFHRVFYDKVEPASFFFAIGV